MKFAHLGDCHLGGWRQPELAFLTMNSFSFAVEKCIKEKVDFVLIAGDLFDTAQPAIETLKQAFREFRKLKEAKIPVFLIAGSHDYSASGKTFLDVLEEAGLAKNVFSAEERENSIILHPTIYKNVAIYGYPGKKSGLEVPEIERVKLQDSPGLFKILMLHTAIRDAVGSLPIPAVDETKLPKVDYLALAHLHVNYNKNSRVYCGPTFPNNLSELEELKGGSFYIVNIPGKAERQEIRLKEVEVLELEIKNSLEAKDKIISALDSINLKDKILILRLSGILEKGKKSDINFLEIEKHAIEKGVYVFLKSTSRLYSKDTEIKFEISSENMEEDIIRKFQEEHKSRFNHLVLELMHSLNSEKKEDEVAKNFEKRIFEDANKALKI